MVTNSIKIDEILLEKVKKYGEIEGIEQTEFINKLLAGAMEQHLLKRAGGAILTLPNPQNYHIDLESAKKALDKIVDCAGEIIGVNLPLPLYSMTAFCEQRLFYELEEDKAKFKENMLVDNGAQCGDSANNTNSAREENK